MCLSFKPASTETHKDELRQFAANFDHKITFDYPVVMVERDGVLIAYFSVINMPILTFGLNPNVCTPRDTSETVSAAISWAKIQHGGCLVTRPDDPKTKFNDTVMHKLGFDKCPFDVFMTKG